MAKATTAQAVLKQQISAIQKQFNLLIKSINSWQQDSLRSTKDGKTKMAINQQAALMKQDAQAKLKQEIVNVREAALGVTGLPTGVLDMIAASTVTGAGAFGPGVPGGAPATLPPLAPAVPFVANFNVPASATDNGYPTNVTQPVYYQPPDASQVPTYGPYQSVAPLYPPQQGADYYPVSPLNGSGPPPGSFYPDNTAYYEPAPVDYYVPSGATMTPDGNGGPIQVSPEVLAALTQQQNATYYADPWRDVWGGAFSHYGADDTGSGFELIPPWRVPGLLRRRKLSVSRLPYFGYAASNLPDGSFLAYGDVALMRGSTPQGGVGLRWNYPDSRYVGFKTPWRYGYRRSVRWSGVGFGAYGTQVGRPVRRMRKRLTAVQALNEMPILLEDFGQAAGITSSIITAVSNLGSAAVSAALTPRARGGQAPVAPIYSVPQAPSPPSSDNTMMYVIGGVAVLGVLMAVMAKKRK